MPSNNELIRGSVEIVILKLLSDNDMYGYQMIKTVNERSNGRTMAAINTGFE